VKGWSLVEGSTLLLDYLDEGLEQSQVTLKISLGKLGLSKKLKK